MFVFIKFSFFIESRTSSVKMVFGVVLSNNDNRCLRKSGLSSLNDSLPCSLPFRSVVTKPDGYLVRKELVILLFECVVEKCFIIIYVFSFPSGVYLGTLNLIALFPGTSILTLLLFH